MKQTSIHELPDDLRLEPVARVAQFLSISRSSVYSMMERGQLPYIKLGKSRRIRWTDVLALVEQNVVSRL